MKNLLVKEKTGLKIMQIVILMIVSLFCRFDLKACGAGVIPHIPTIPYVPSAMEDLGSALDGQFFLDIEKSVVNEMFNTKRLNPIFRHFTLTGNERRTRSKSTKEKQAEARELPPCGVDHPEVEPVINLHRLH